MSDLGGGGVTLTDALAAERDRYKAALESIVAAGRWPHDDGPICDACLVDWGHDHLDFCAVGKALRALERTE